MNSEIFKLSQESHFYCMHACMQIKNSWSLWCYWNIFGIHIGSWYVSIKSIIKSITNIPAPLGPWTSHWLLLKKKKHEILFWIYPRMLGHEKNSHLSTTISFLHQNEIISWVFQKHVLAELVPLYKIFHWRASYTNSHK